jgi:methyltransferase-like protein
MAQDLPDGQFVGIDLSGRQTSEGNGLLQRLPLKNIVLRQQNIMDVDDGLGEFDYIICHGVFSWVPRRVQDKILDVGRRNLKSGGVLYLSYNTYPGWHARGVVRDMMRYHAQSFDDPQMKIRQSRGLLNFLVDSARSHTDTYRCLLRDEATILKDQGDEYLFHEHLEEVNVPLYFHEFIERAMAAGLQYLGESDFPSMLAENFEPQTAAILKDAPLLRQEQYMDFLRNRMFRGTLLCREGVRVDRNVDPRRITQLQLVLERRLETPGTNVQASEPVVCRGPSETAVATAPLTKAALLCLDEAWPRSVRFDDLLAAAEQRQDTSQGQLRLEDGGASESHLAIGLTKLYAKGILRALVDPPKFVTTVSQRPTSSPLARLQAGQQPWVTNRRHESIRLQGAAHSLLPCLDGQHDRAALLAALQKSLDRGEFDVQREGQPLRHVDRDTLGRILDATLEKLAMNALLVA